MTVASDDPGAASAGTGLDRFEDRGLVGVGGMGVVRLAWDRRDQRHVAVKTLRAYDPESALFLRREFRALKTIRHPNLIRLFELFATAEGCFFTMEFLPGQDLAGAARGGAGPGEPSILPVAEIAELFLQVADGLAAVHAAERLHRDIKPSNVLVTPEGRAVVLDFGLAQVFGPGVRIGGPDGMSGTMEYVSPEQAWSEPLGIATDWYSFGAMLYEVVCGALPFEGMKLGARFMAMRKGDPPLLSQRLPGAPAALVELCEGLLRRDPAARVGHAEVTERLGSLLSAPRAPRPPSTLHLPFVGRREELAALESIARDLREGRRGAAVVCVRGPSGIGKSELVRRFLGRLEAQGETVVLQGRCQPQETVPFKAFDAVIDELSLHLERLGEGELERLVTPDLPALLRVFPVLRRIGAFERAAAEAPEGSVPVEPREIRDAAVRALRALLAEAAAHELFVLQIDDFQWGDLDSVALLRDLLRAPSPPGVLVLLSFRSEDGETAETLKALGGLRERELAGIVHQIDLAALTPVDMRELGDHLRGSGFLHGPLEVDSLVDEASGSPFIVGELVRWHRTRAPGVPTGPMRVNDAIRARVEQLDAVERDVLEVIAVAGHALEPELALRVARAGDRGVDVLYALDETWVRRVSSGVSDDLVEPLHDRLREVVTADVPHDRFVAWHLALALALREDPACEPLVLLDHYRKAEDWREAAHFGELAARRAEATLAFDLAARLYELTIELTPGGGVATLHVRLAEARKNAGLGVAAAEAYERAAEVMARTAHNTRDRLTLHQRAAELFLHAGELQRGMTLLQASLERIGESIPRSPMLGILSAGWRRMRLLWRGLTFTPRDPALLPSDVLLRLDTLWGSATALSMFTHSRADPIGVQHLLLALDAGDERRVRRSLRYEAAFQAGLGKSFLGRFIQRTGVLSAVAALPAADDDPYDRAWACLCLASVRWMEADWVGCAEAGREGERLFRTACRGAHWETAVVNLFMLAALVSLGEVEELDRRVRDALRDAQARGDVFSATIYRLGQPASVWLYADQPEEGRRLAAEAVKEWPGLDFDTQHYHHLIATTQLALYEGDPWGAWAMLSEKWPALEAAQLLQYRAILGEMLHLRARTALACVILGGPPPRAFSRMTRARLLARARSDARVTRGIWELGWSPPLADSILATIQQLEGEDPAAALDAAIAGFQREHMELMVLAMRHRRALARADGSEAEILEQIRALHIVAPERLLGMLAPWGSGRDAGRSG